MAAATSHFSFPVRAMRWRVALLVAGCLVAVACLPGCRPAPPPLARPGVVGARPGEARAAPPGRSATSRREHRLSLPRDATTRYLLDTQPLPVPAGGLFVHLELAPLGRHPDGPRLGRAFTQGLRVESAGSALLGSYLRRCGLDPLRNARAMSLVQPIEGRPGSDRVVVLWGLVGARRLVACLGRQVEAEGGSTAVLALGGEPGLALDRAASDLHLDVLALDDETLLSASGPSFRRAVRALAGVPGAADPAAASIAASPLYQRAVSEAPERTVLLAVVPRFPKALPHLYLPSDVPRNIKEGRIAVRLTASGIALSVHLGVKGQGRAGRWAKRLPGRVSRLFPFVPQAERPFLARARPSASDDLLRLDLTVPRAELAAFGRAAERWLPW